MVGEGDAPTYAARIAAMGPLFDDWEMHDEGHAWHGREVLAHIPFSCRIKQTGRRWDADSVVRITFDDQDKVTELVGY